MNDRPDARELVESVRLFLEKELLPALSDARLRFQTLVAANVLSIVERELPGEEAALRQEWQTLAGLLGGQDPAPDSVADLRGAVRSLNAKLCAGIRNGDFDEPSQEQYLLAVLKHQVAAKLAVANPRHLAPG